MTKRAAVRGQDGPSRVARQPAVAAERRTVETVKSSSRLSAADLADTRRRQIVHAATSLMVRHGYAATTVREIALQAGMSMGQMYDYVRTKDDILVLAFEYWRETWFAGLDELRDPSVSAAKQLHDIIAFLVDMGNEHRDVALLVNRESGNLKGSAADIPKSLERRIVSEVADILDLLPTSDRTDDPTEVRRLAVTLVLLSQGWVLKGYLLRDLFGDDTRLYTDWIISSVGLPVLKAARPSGRDNRKASQT